MALTFVAILLRILSNPVANVFQKRLAAGGCNALMVNFISYLLLSGVCLVPAAGVTWAVLPWQFWMYATIAGVFGAVGNGFLVLALRRGDLSVLGPINSYKSVVGMIVGIILLGEIPSVAGMAGVVIIIAGSYLVFETTPEGFSWKLLRNAEIRYRLFAMVLTAIEAVFIKKVILYSDTTVSFIAWCWFGCLFAFIQLWAMKVKIRGEIKHLGYKEWMSFVALVACVGTMQYTTNYAFKHIDVGYALALFQLSTIVSIALGWRLYHEKAIARKMLGAIVMIGGSALIILG